jgi:ParB/RepB/Spo0J family partition protein
MQEQTEVTQLERLDERYARLRIVQPQQERALAASLRRLGQLMPLVVCERGSTLAIVDGFKRLPAARAVGLPALHVRVVALSEPAALSAMVPLNHTGKGLCDLEEALVVRALCREQSLEQTQVATLLGRHKSWVSRRLSLVERLSPEVQEDVRVGLVGVTVAREVARLPRGNQREVASCVHTHGLSSGEASALCTLFETTSDRAQQRYLLAQPREALAARQRLAVAAYDTRLGPSTNLLRGRLLATMRATADLIQRIEECRPSGWTATERLVLEPLVRQVRGVTALFGDKLASACEALEKANAA